MEDLWKKETLLVKEHKVSSALKTLYKFNEGKLSSTRSDSEQELYKLNREIRPFTRLNWELEKDIEELDHKIGLMLQYQTDLAMKTTKKESNKNLKVKAEDQQIKKSPCEGGKQRLFEQMFSLLLHDPKYLAFLSHNCPIEDSEDFVKTVIVDIFGGRPKYEAKLLQIFDASMRIEFEKNRKMKDFGAVFRNKSAAMQMFKQYALAGDGKGIIKRMLTKTIHDLCEGNINLEVDSLKMYKEFIKNYEQQTKQPWPKKREGVREEEAFNYDFIQKIYLPRIEQLRKIANQLLMSVIHEVKDVPWGVRWICKEFADLSGEYFPNASNYQRGALVGGFFFLRLVNPAILVPETYGIISDRPKRNVQGTLRFAGKIVQKLSNGTKFKELHMQPVNNFLEEKREPVQRFLAKLIEVPDLSYQLDMYQLLKYNEARDFKMLTTYNQLILMHRLLSKHKKQWLKDDSNDPMVKILAQMGQVVDRKNKFKRKENRTVVLHLQIVDDKKKDSMVSTMENISTGIGKNVMQLFSNDDSEREDEIESALQCLLKFCKKSPPDKWQSNKEYETLLKTNDFGKFLEYCIDQGKDPQFTEEARNTLKAVDEAVDYINLTRFGQDPYTRSDFFIRTVEQVRTYKNRVRRLKVHVQSVSQGLMAIKKHNTFLKEKRDDYLQVLDNVNRGGAHKKRLVHTKNDKNTPKEVQISHKDMMYKYGIIHEVAPEHSKNAEKYLQYTIKRTGVGVYEIHVVAKVMFVKKKIFDEPIKISMLALLDKEDKYQDMWEVEGLIKLNVTLLKEFLSDTFKDYGQTDD